MVPLLRDLARRRQPRHPLLEIGGWWRRPLRHMYDVAVHDDGTVEEGIEPDSMDVRDGKPPVPPLIITGATGTLAYAFARLCDLRGIPYLALSRHEMDITDPGAIERMMREQHPWAVVNAAGYVGVDEAETDIERCRHTNAIGPGLLAQACSRHGAQFLTFSSNLVFDGRQTRPYLESDAVAPLNEYGRSKAEGEARVFDALPNALIIRAGDFFGPWDQDNFVTATRRALEAGRPISIGERQVVSPTYVPDLVNASLDLLIDCDSGIRHLANEGAITWGALARRVAEHSNRDETLVTETGPSPTGSRARRPHYSALGTARGQILPPLDDALARYFQDRPDPDIAASPYTFCRRLVT